MKMQRTDTQLHKGHGATIGGALVLGIIAACVCGLARAQDAPDSLTVTTGTSQVTYNGVLDFASITSQRVDFTAEDAHSATRPRALPIHPGRLAMTIYAPGDNGYMQDDCNLTGWDYSAGSSHVYITCPDVQP